MIVANLKALIRGHGEIQIGLWGGADSGKTHLLNAAAEFAREQGIAMQIYDGAQLIDCDAVDFDDFEACDVLAIDNLDRLSRDPAWETRLYQLINRCRDGEFRLIYAISKRPEDLNLELDDLRSRLQWGLLMQLPASDDGELGEMLRQRAQRLGINLSAEVVNYLLTHYPRNPATQMEILRRLDDVSLSHQRRVTIPLIKQALADSGD